MCEMGTDLIAKSKKKNKTEKKKIFFRISIKIQFIDYFIFMIFIF